MLKLCDSEPIQVQARHRLYSLWSMYTHTCLDLCDPKGSRPYGTCEVYVVGRCSIIPVRAMEYLD